MPFNLVSDLDTAATPDLQDRGLHYGDGLFETMLLKQGQIKYWAEHFCRLRSGCQRLNIACPEESWFETQLQPYFQLNQDLVIKLIVTRGSGGRGLKMPDRGRSNIYLLHYEFNNSTVDQSISAYISEITLPDNKALAGIKHLNRLNYVLATDALSKKPEYQEALLSNDSGYIIESIINNLFFVKNSIVFTPDLSFNGVDGIMRKQVIKQLEHRGITVNIGHYQLQDILAADECFLTNSVQGVRALTQVEQQRYPVGNITQELQQVLHGV
jgi:4-amino-4-deoxychorismate lyase